MCARGSGVADFHSGSTHQWHQLHLLLSCSPTPQATSTEVAHLSAEDTDRAYSILECCLYSSDLTTANPAFWVPLPKSQAD